MKKTLILAAALLSLGTGVAFSSDGDANGWAAPAQVSGATTSAQSGQRLLTTGNQGQTNVYGLFGSGGFTQGGEQ